MSENHGVLTTFENDCCLAEWKIFGLFQENSKINCEQIFAFNRTGFVLKSL